MARKIKFASRQNGKNSGCVPHAVSVMRNALGYKTPLPRSWKEEYNTPCGPMLLDIFNKAFPGHVVIVMEVNSTWPLDAPVWDDYLMAFVYSDRSPKATSNESHMVIGWPWPASKHMYIDYIIAVSHENIREKSK